MYELIPQPAFSPDLALSDFFLFQNLKKDVRGCHFRSDDKVVTAVKKWVNGKGPVFFFFFFFFFHFRADGLEHRWSK